MQTVPWGTGEYSKHGKEIRLLSCHPSQIARQCTLEIIYYANMKEETQTGGSVVIPNLKRKKKNTCQSGWYHWGTAFF